jgi:hypothetical protein
LKKDRNLRKQYDGLITSECGKAELDAIIEYLLDKYSDILENELLPSGKNKAQYLGDVVQVLCAADA